MAGHIRAVVYSRVSTDAQERDGTSLVREVCLGIQCQDGVRKEPAIRQLAA